MTYLDTRDLYTRQQELQDELDNLIEARNDTEEEINQSCEDGNYGPEEAEELAAVEQSLQEWIDNYQEELDALNELESEVGGEWMHGTILIPEEDFEEYAQDLADDLHGDAVRDQSWPFYHIDWEQAAKDLQQDYSSVTFEGTDYFFRS